MCKLTVDIFNIIFNAFGVAEEKQRQIIPVGGQAVIEGVLMKGPKHWGLAVRNPKNEIVIKTWRGSNWTEKSFWKLPIIRGFVTMVEMMRIGMRALSISADISLGEEENISTFEMITSFVVAIAAVVGIFIVLPMSFSEFAVKHFGISHVGKNICEGLVRGIIFVLYVWVISLWKDMARVFEYHGAEHKTINAYEKGAKLIPSEVAKYSRIHRRCGTSFLLVVILVSIFVFSLINSQSILFRIGSRIVLLPVVIGISYEFIRAAAKSDTWGYWSIYPALALQFITTRVPSEDQIEVALAALDAALNDSCDDTVDVN